MAFDPCVVLWRTELQLQLQQACTDSQLRQQTALGWLKAAGMTPSALHFVQVACSLVCVDC